MSLREISLPSHVHYDYELREKLKKGKITQNECIRRHLETYTQIDWMQSFFGYDIKRLSARIYDLRHGKDGGECLDIDSEDVELDSGKQVVRYYLNFE